jgi:DNA-binding transcriptional MerR regulator
MSKPSLVIVLAEDQRQRQFIYRFLKNAGIRSDQIRALISPSGRGSAEQWVRENFALQAKKCRARTVRADTGMVVLLDADLQNVSERLAALDNALISAGQNPIDRSRDLIARLIARRNIETWILFLATGGVANPQIDESTDYKKTRNGDEWSELIPTASQKLFAWTRPRAVLPVNIIDSLQRGIDEISRALTALA